MNELVSVVILNWNGLKYIFDCVESVISQTYNNIEIVVVDNHSTDGSIEKLQKRFPEFVYVLNSSNEGFARGMNKGIQKSRGVFIMALNMDVCLDNNAIENFVEEFNVNSAVGAMMGKEFIWGDKGLIDIPTVSSGPGFLKKRGQGFFDKSLIDEKVFSFGAMGSFPIFRKKALIEVYEITGYYYDPKFETGWEDKDLFFRLHHSGWQFLYNPSSIGYHAVSGSVGGAVKLIEKNLSYQIRTFRNRYFFIYKNYPTKLILRFSIYILLVELIIPFYYLFLNPKSLKALIIGQWLFLMNIKKIKLDRRLILSNSKLSLKSILKYFKKF